MSLIPSIPPETWDALLAGQEAPLLPPEPPVYPTTTLTPAPPSMFRTRLADALAGVSAPQVTPGTTGGQALVGGLLSGAARGFSASQRAKMAREDRVREQSDQLSRAESDRNYQNALTTWRAKLTDYYRTQSDKSGKVRITRRMAEDMGVPEAVGTYGDPLEISQRITARKSSPMGTADPEVAKVLGVNPNSQQRVSDILSARQLLKGSSGSSSLMGTPANVTNISPKALSQAAGLYVVTGKLPGLGIGGQAGEDKKKIMNRAADLFPGVDIAQNSATFGANKSSLAAIQKLYDSATAFETTALKNAEVLKGTLKGLYDSGSPLVNGPIRSLNKNVLGDTNMAAFSTAIETVKPEFARLLSSPGASGMLTDTARKEMEAVLSNQATVPQLLRSIDVLTQDAENRRSAYQTALDTIRERIGAGGAGESPVQRWARDPVTGKPVKVGN